MREVAAGKEAAATAATATAATVRIQTINQSIEVLQSYTCSSEKITLTPPQELG